MPYSGPAAPPTFEISAIPTSFRSAGTSAGSPAASSLSMTARIPRSMLMPWSPSPIAASSAVSASFSSAITRAKARSQADTSPTVMAAPSLTRPTAVRR